MDNIGDKFVSKCLVEVNLCYLNLSSTNLLISVDLHKIAIKRVIAYLLNALDIEILSH